MTSISICQIQGIALANVPTSISASGSASSQLSASLNTSLYNSDSTGSEPFTSNASSEQIPLRQINTSIILLFDASGSMINEGKMDNARTAAINALSTLRPGDEAALIAYYNCSSIVVEQPFITDGSSFSSKIERIKPDSSTSLYSAIAFAKDYMKRNAKGKIQRIMLLTDGLETCGGSP